VEVKLDSFAVRALLQLARTQRHWRWVGVLELVAASELNESCDSEED
jgi:hypothetical protein